MNRAGSAPTKSPALLRSSALVALALIILAIAVSGCGPPAPACLGGETPSAPASASELPISETSPPEIAALARQYEPTVEVSTLDRFWPVSVATVLHERDVSGNGVQLVSHGQVVADPATLADLSPSDRSSAYLEYPARLADKAAQMGAFLRGAGVSESLIGAWPTDVSRYARETAQIYFYEGKGCTYGGRPTRSYRALQYWFFYGFNYYPMTVDTQTMLSEPLRADTADVDLHEGDWEHIAVLLAQEASRYVPKFVWLARHSSEGELIPWDRVELDSQGHPLVYPAFGGHPSYPSCGAHPRALLAAAVYDYSVCQPGLYVFPGANTRLVDLARVGWSCWPGFFGTTRGTKESSNADDPTGQILVAGPRSPLRQMENQNVCLKPNT